jgi:hypothetical protein
MQEKIMARERKAKIEERKQLETKLVPAMFQILCAATTTYLMEYVYARTNEDPESTKAWGEDFRRFIRWIIRRYGPESAMSIMMTVILATREGDRSSEQVPGMDGVIKNLFSSSLVEIYDNATPHQA